jgi:hypothetical protein
MSILASMAGITIDLHAPMHHIHEDRPRALRIEVGTRPELTPDGDRRARYRWSAKYTCDWCDVTSVAEMTVFVDVKDVEGTVVWHHGGGPGDV